MTNEQYEAYNRATVARDLLALCPKGDEQCWVDEATIDAANAVLQDYFAIPKTLPMEEVDVEK